MFASVRTAAFRVLTARTAGENFQPDCSAIACFLFVGITDDLHLGVWQHRAQGLCLGDLGLTKYNEFSNNPHDSLVQVKLPIGISPEPSDTPFADFGSNCQTKPVPPETNQLVFEVDTSLVRQVFGAAERKGFFFVIARG